MSRIAGSSTDVALGDLRRRYVPILSTIAASLFVLLPIVVSTPLVPDFAFLVLIAWRLLRPEIWTAQTALLLGLFNDLVAGHPIGQSMALWAIAFLLFDLIDSRVGWRDYWMDWLFASIAIPFYTFGGWYIARLMGSETRMIVMVPQILLSLLAFPLVARIVLSLDRWRLSR
ncbi:rod shape-determining protein MreD [Sphingosinicella rhizophila]|uniref:Rod shape-determining protein MreD n=1 Tax=Sphingosinicella rhizophila TaxID=3050082 RepID=A0ABU3Q325_9SPHN|nr:rod shape-determining protein MreD [Sphingosinicella sp. GR2756]MDT9597813.1 rod shape-determining protein MreD [Sphingosinicella sp. GR2756]